MNDVKVIHTFEVNVNACILLQNDLYVTVTVLQQRGLYFVALNGAVIGTGSTTIEGACQKLYLSKRLPLPLNGVQMSHISDILNTINPDPA